MKSVTFTCTECGSAISVIPKVKANRVSCQQCGNEQVVKFDQEHEKGILKVCPGCRHKDFYKQKDFNRKIGVLLFVIAAILSIFTYGLSFVVLWLVDLFLFKRLLTIAICYHCQAIFRGTHNLAEIKDYDHETNDRIVYSS